jgi:hypothetical protein
MTTTIALTAAAVRRTLAYTPLDEHYPLEAALAWHQLRPTGRAVARTPGDPDAVKPPLLPVVGTNHAEVATRLSRLLCGLAWVTVTRPDDTGRDTVRVEVRRADYNWVVRALRGIWQRIRREFGTAATGDPRAAAALWRMAILIGGVGPGGDTIQLGARTPAAALVLVNAAATLDTHVALECVRGRCVVLVRRPGDVRRLLVAAGAMGQGRQPALLPTPPRT